MKLVLTLSLLLISSMLQASSVDRIHSLVESTLYSCGDRIWPEMDWKKYEINLVSETQAVQIHQGKLTSLAPEKANLRGKFRFEKNGITLNLDYFQSPQVAFEFMVHELFHAVGQKQLRALPSNQQDIYPANHLPRLQREELAQALFDYVTGKNKKLNRVTTWFYRHLKNNEDLSSDLIEGSAEYVESIASGLSKLGCHASEDSLINYSAQRINENGMPFDKSLEHYRIGALSYLALRKHRLSPVGSFKTGRHPLIYITTSSDYDQSIESDSLLDHSAEMIVNLSNKRNGEVITKVEESKHFVFVSFSNLAGSFDHSGTFKFKDQTFYEDLTVTNDNNIQFNGHAVQKKLCGSNGFLIAVDKEEESANIDTFNSTKVSCF